MVPDVHSGIADTVEFDVTDTVKLRCKAQTKLRCAAEANSLNESVIISPPTSA